MDSDSKPATSTYQTTGPNQWGQSRMALS